ncbi:MAG: universal stress protein [Haloarculaceae archaeon]
MYDVLLVGIDGSDGSNRAIEHGLALARDYDATLYVLSVVDTTRYGEPALSSAELVIDELEDRAHELLAGVVDRAEEVDVPVEIQSRHGDPHEQIAAYADEIDADLTILGAQGQTHSRAELGSVADRVVHAIERPIMLA